MKRSILTIVALGLAVLLAALAAGCDNDAGDVSATQEKIKVAVTLLPQAGFVEAIGGERVDVIVMVPPGASPHTYEVTPEQMTGLSNAVMYAKVGTPVEFEVAWLDKLIAVNQSMLVVDCSKGVDLIESQDPDEPGMDPHIWLSVKNAEIMVNNIYDGLVQVDPANESYYKKNLKDYEDALEKLDDEISADLSSLKNRSFIVVHPSFGYFAREYDLKEIAIEQGGKEPDAEYLARLIQEAKDAGIRVVFISPQFSTKSAEVVAKEIGGEVAIIDPLSRNFIANMRTIASTMKQAME